jgi:hypothetical protein
MRHIWVIEYKVKDKWEIGRPCEATTKSRALAEMKDDRDIFFEPDEKIRLTKYVPEEK